MAFEMEYRKYIEDYVQAHMGDEIWHINYFDFIDDIYLAKRLGEEFISTRYIYKVLEGLGANDWLLRAQIRLQVLSYASIYEASLHHLLFDNLAADSRVVALTEFPTKKEISIPKKNLDILSKYLEHDGKTIIPTYASTGKTDESKVRFDRKAECAFEIGIIEESLKNELIEFYAARNSIHIHAEIRKDFNYEIDLSVRLYRRLQPFKEQVRIWQQRNNI